MESIIQKLLEHGFGEMIDLTREDFLKKDEVYQACLKNTDMGEAQFMQLNLSEKDRDVIETYIEYIQKEMNHYADISYFAGMKDAIHMMAELGFLDL